MTRLSLIIMLAAIPGVAIAEPKIPSETQTVIAGMLTLMPPGKTVYSRVVLDTCDIECQKKQICELPSILCAAPSFSQEVFESKLNSTLGVDKDQLRLASFTRAENYEEGLKRYAVIAEAIVQISQSMTWNTGSATCKNECTKLVNAFYNTGLNEQCKQCVKDHPWMGTSRELQAALTAVMYGESGFRQDIHAGIGALSKGDCQWRDKESHHRVAPFSKNSSPVPGTCRSFCLGQINIGDGERWGNKAADLVGTDLASTKRCASVAARVLSASRQQCSGPLSSYKGDWARGMFSAYGTGGTCKAMMGTAATLKEADWPGKRSTWFWNLMKHPVDLSDQAKVVLGLQD